MGADPNATPAEKCFPSEHSTIARQAEYERLIRDADAAARDAPEEAIALLKRILDLKPDHAKFAGYFNVDNGTGAIRGVYLQGNEAVAPVFQAWMQPFKNLGLVAERHLANLWKRLFHINGQIVGIGPEHVAIVDIQDGRDLARMR